MKVLQQIRFLKTLLLFLVLKLRAQLDINARLAKYLDLWFKLYVPDDFSSPYSTKNSVVLVQALKHISPPPRSILIPFDVVGLFPNIPRTAHPPVLKGWDYSPIKDNNRCIYLRCGQNFWLDNTEEKKVTGSYPGNKSCGRPAAVLDSVAHTEYHIQFFKFRGFEICQ